MIFKKGIALSFDDICLIPQYSDLDSRSEASLWMGYQSNPIIASCMIHTNTPQMFNYLIKHGMTGMIHRYFKNANEQLIFARNIVDHCEEYICWENDSKITFLNESYISFSVGRDKEWIDTLVEAGVKRFCVDMAHGFTSICINTIHYIKMICPDSIIIAGNVTTYEATKSLVEAGAIGCRVGIASGAICSTNKNTAFGLPMVTTIMECAEIKREYPDTIIIADGGIRGAADILKSIACGADYVMCGKLLASTSLAEGPFYDKDKYLVNKNEIESGYFKPYYAEYAGMASHEMRQRNGSHDTTNISIEGEAGLIKYTGETDQVIKAIEANLRAGMSYCGARNWQEFRDRAVIQQMSTAGFIEKQVHLIQQD